MLRIPGHRRRRDWRGMPVRLAATTLLVGTTLSAGTALAQQPDLAFLEYLGSFDEDDESWYVDVQLSEEEPTPEAAQIVDTAAVVDTGHESGDAEHEDD